MPIQQAYAAHCDFCDRNGPYRPQSHDAARAAERVGYEVVHCDFYGNEAWACPACKHGEKVRNFVATMRGDR